MSVDDPSSPFESLTRVTSSAAALADQADGAPVPKASAARARERDSIVQTVVLINQATATAQAHLAEHPDDRPLFAPVVARLHAVYSRLRVRFRALL